MVPSQYACICYDPFSEQDFVTFEILVEPTV